MLFKIHKNLFTEIVSRIAPAFVKTTNPQDIGQYLVLKLDKKKNLLTAIVNRQEVTVKIEIDGDGDLLTIEEDGVFVINGEPLYELLSRSTVIDQIVINFDAKKDVIKAQDPSQTAISLLGSMEVLFPGGESWSFPVLDLASIPVPTNPTIELKGDDHFKVNAQEFSKFILQVGMAVGKDNLDARFRNVLIRTTGNRYEIIATTGIHLAWVRALCKEMSGEFSMTIPHEQTMLVTNVSSPELDLTIVHHKGTPGSCVCHQEFLYGERSLGKIMIKTTCSPEPFAKFDKMIKNLDFISSLKLKTQQFKPICSRMDIFTDPRTTVAVDTKKGTLVFSKVEDGKVRAKGITIPFSAVSGEPINLLVSSRHLLLAVSNAEADEIEWKFSGQKSLTCMILSDNLMTYFAPFTEE